MHQQTRSPVDGSIYVERALADASALDSVLARADAAHADWRRTPLDQRIAVLTKAIDAFVAREAQLSEEITWQMGRPIRHAPGEIAGFAHRARTMIRLAPEALADIVPTPREGLTRFIRREPLGVVLVLAAWNYPYLIAVNAVIPALLAGNTVVLKHSDQTPLCAERIGEALSAAGIPEGVYQHIHMSHDRVAQAVADDRVAHVCFTGSVAGGRAVHAAAAGHFKTVGLELGGKDAAYVRPDCAFDATVDNLVDGAFFNAGQSCCGIERIFVHRDRYDAFVDAFVAATRQYVLGNPTHPDTTLGPLVRPRAATFVQGHIDDAVSRGARALIDPAPFGQPGPGYLAPQVLVDVTDDMPVMRDETFGPVVAIAAVDSDDEAVRRVNDSAFGLTSSVWTQDDEAARALAERLQTGTVFQNRCDHLDPELAWVGIKHSGRGCTLSRVGFEALTRPKSFHLRRL